MSADGQGLEAVGISFTYPGGIKVISEWEARFVPGTVTALTGPSGSGKSTLLYILGLMHRHTSGDLLISGVSTASLSDRQRAGLRARRFGFVFQDAALDATRTVLDNVIETALYRAERRCDAVVQAMDLMEEFGVRLRASHRPGQVSGGQAQRIALCRALLGNPRFILADEPTGNLDPASRDVVVEALRSRAQDGACVVVATHDDGVVAACDERIALGGRP